MSLNQQASLSSALVHQVLLNSSDLSIQTSGLTFSVADIRAKRSLTTIQINPSLRQVAV